MKLGALPSNHVETREALHQLAFFAVSPVRYKATGRMGLTATPGGFGTPEFGGRVVRVEGDLLVHESEDGVATQTITTIRGAAEFFGIAYEPVWFSDFHDPLSPADPDTPLDISDEASRAIGEWFHFGMSVLDELRAHGQGGDDVSEVQLWPEHFDPATELGDPEKGQRASFGASPGDGSHPEPYLYVAPWSEIDQSNPYWNSQSFSGAILGLPELLESPDPHDRAVSFLLDGYRILHSG